MIGFRYGSKSFSKDKVVKAHKVNRVEIINHVNSKTDYGREYVNYLPEGAEVELQFQDDGRTLKVFIQKRTNWNPETLGLMEAYGDNPKNFPYKNPLDK